MSHYYYAIIERSDLFCVLSTGFGSEICAWNEANKLAEQYPDLILDYDVLFFVSEKEQIDYLRKEAQCPVLIGRAEHLFDESVTKCLKTKFRVRPAKKSKYSLWRLMNKLKRLWHTLKKRNPRNWDWHDFGPFGF